MTFACKSANSSLRPSWACSEAAGGSAVGACTMMGGEMALYNFCMLCYFSIQMSSC